jgi:hypothetical protein
MAIALLVFSFINQKALNKLKKMNERLHYITLSQILLEKYNKLRILTWHATFALKTIEGS